MKNKILITSLSVILVSLISLSFINNSTHFWKTPINDVLKKIVSKFEVHSKVTQEERLYLQFDKSLYKPGETVWFSAYLRNATDFKASEKSDILIVELISPNETVVSKIKLIAENGVAEGDFLISETMPGGIYKIKAYTNWQQNFENDYVFEKEIQVQKFVLPRLKMKLDFTRDAYGAGDKVIAELNFGTNSNQPLANKKISFYTQIDGQKAENQTTETDENGDAYIVFNLPENLSSNDGLLNAFVEFEGRTESISRSIPIVLNNISLEFFPEGGDLVADVNTNIAFRALNEFGKPADIEAEIFDAKGNKITSTKSFHDGMGKFNFKPENGKKYFAKITKPKGIEKKYELPKTAQNNFVMNVENSQNKKIEVKINSKIEGEISLVAQVRGEIYHAENYTVKQGENNFTINTADFPIGVAQITLFNPKGTPKAERLVFVNKHKQLNIKIKTNKEQYLPREKVKLTITAEDENGKAVAGNISLAVVNDQLINFADDKQGTILAKLLLESDVNFEIDEPNFYFDKNEPDADQALDLLLLTAGWRRYTWKQVLENDFPKITHKPEKADIAGYVYDDISYEKITKAQIEVIGTNRVYKPDANGRFQINGINILKNKDLKLTAEGYEETTFQLTSYNQNLRIYMHDPKKPYPVLEIIDDEMDFAFDMMEVAEDMPMQGNMRNIPVDDLKKKEEGKAEIVEKEEAQEGEVIDVDQPVFELKDRRDPIMPPADNLADFYLAKEFAAPVYDKNQDVETRTDFRSTIYWNGNVQLDKNGKAELEFYTSDEVTSFRVTAEGIGNEGLIGHSEALFFTQLPFAMTTVLPVEVIVDDIVSVPLILKNTTQKEIAGRLEISAPESFELLTQLNPNLKIGANEVKTIYLKYKVKNSLGSENFRIAFEAKGLRDAFEKQITVQPKGFPVVASFSSQSLKQKFDIEAQNVVEGSMTAQLVAYPSVVTDLMQSVAAILREPSGCFEQTSMSSYPNLMVVDYLQTTGTEDEALLARADNLLDKGYNRLTTFETPEKGYEWFGGAPGHEALSAYGLMQFNDMLGVYDGVDKEMIDRTANWLMSRKDGKGGFERNRRALDSYGGASEAITNAYIVWALSEAGYTDIEKEAETSYNQAIESEDPYLMALMANTMFNLKKAKKAEKLMQSLYKLQNKEGSWTGSTHSITRSTGNSLAIETSSIVLLAMLKSETPKMQAISDAVSFLVESRSGYGMFGNTQGTILALKALTAYAKFSKKTDESGTIEIYVDNKKVAEKSYEKGHNEPILIEGLEEFLSEGKNKILVKYAGAKNALPYTFTTEYSTTLPQSSDECNINFDCKLATTKARVGETVRLTSTITNKTAEGQPMTVAIIGIPAGLTAQPWQLKELQEKQIVDYYETNGNNVVLYYRDLAPSEVKTVNLDLKAELPGTFDAPASSAYLYYTNEHKIWKALDRIEIEK